MKRRHILAGSLVVLCLFLIWHSPRPSLRNTVKFALRHQEELIQFVALAREENAGGELSWWRGSNTLSGTAWGWNFQPTISSEVSAAWENIRSYGYFDSVTCSYEHETGAMEITFSTKGPWKAYEEGNYYVAHCLVWRDASYSRFPLKSYWHPLTQAEGMAPALEGGGGWYYTSHKHYDG